MGRLIQPSGVDQQQPPLQNICVESSAPGVRGLIVETHVDSLGQQIVERRGQLLVTTFHGVWDATQAATELVHYLLCWFLGEQVVPVVDQWFLAQHSTYVRCTSKVAAISHLKLCGLVFEWLRCAVVNMLVLIKAVALHRAWLLLDPSQTGWYSIYLPWKDGRLSWQWRRQDLVWGGAWN